MTPDQIRHQMIGIPDLKDPTLFEAVFSTLQESLGEIENWSMDENTARRVSLPTILDTIAGRKLGMLFLRRRSAPKFEAWVTFGRNPNIYLDMDPLLHPSLWQLPFDAGSRLSELLQPDVANTYIRTTARAWTSDLEKWQKMMGQCGNLAPLDYVDQGPRGLVQRTVLGPSYVEQFDAELLRATPHVVIRPLSWGGLEIDLAEKPWTVPLEELAVRWREAMDHLKPAGIFCRRFTSLDRYVSFTRGPKCVIPGPRK